MSGPNRVEITELLPIDDYQSRSVDCDEADLFIVAYDGQIYAYRNRCPHLGIELNWMPDQFVEAGGDLIICSTHGALFRIENGLCVSGPCQGQSLEAVPVIEESGRTFLEW